MYENTYQATRSIVALTAKDMVPPELEKDKDLESGNLQSWLDKLNDSKVKCLQGWQTRWCVLDRCEFRYYNEPDDQEPIRILDLKECEECQVDQTRSQHNCFRLVFPWRVFYFCASTPNEANKWLTSIEKKIGILRKIKR